jgi:hypothetical protein
MMFANFIGSGRFLVFELLDLVAQRSGVFVILGCYRLLQVLRQSAQAIAQLNLAVRPLREFAYVLGSLVHRLEQTAKAFSESNITDAATEPARLLEIRLRETAHGTFLGGRALLDFFGRTNPEEKISQGESSRVLHAFFFRAGIAEVHLLHLAFKDLRQENCRIIAFANVAQHLCRLDRESPETFNPGLLSTFCADGAFDWIRQR